MVNSRLAIPALLILLQIMIGQDCCGAPMLGQASKTSKTVLLDSVCDDQARALPKYSYTFFHAENEMFYGIEITNVAPQTPSPDSRFSTMATALSKHIVAEWIQSKRYPETISLDCSIDRRGRVRLIATGTQEEEAGFTIKIPPTHPQGITNSVTLHLTVSANSKGFFSNSNDNQALYQYSKNGEPYLFVLPTCVMLDGSYRAHLIGVSAAELHELRNHAASGIDIENAVHWLEGKREIHVAHVDLIGPSPSKFCFRGSGD